MNCILNDVNKSAEWKNGDKYIVRLIENITPFPVLSHH